MPSDNYNEKEGYTRIFLVIAIVVCLIFMVFASYSSVRLKTDDGFGKNYYRNYENNPTQNMFLFDNTDDYLLQNFTVMDKDNIGYGFCFGYNLTNGTGVQVNIINKDLDVMGTSFITDSSDHVCTDLDSTLIEQDNFIGIQCVTCDENNAFYLREEFAGDTVKRVYYNGTVNISDDTTLNYILYGDSDYQSVFRLFLIWFIIILIVLLIGFIAVGGINQVYNYIYDNFGGKEK